MSKKAAELWERGQELDDSAEELWESIVERNKRLDWDRERIARQLGLSTDETNQQRFEETRR